MNKIPSFLLLAILIVTSAGCAGPRTLQANTGPIIPSAAAPADTAVPGPGYQDIPYEIEGTAVPLVNGASEMEAAPGSVTKIVTRYMGKDAFGDLNGDGLDDAAFLLTRTGGGSGTFFYVVAALRTAAGYRGTNGILLGDRITPQSAAIENGILKVTFLDRKPDESFAVQPSVETARSFKVADGRLVEAAASFTDPFAYCAAVGKIDAPDSRYTGEQVPNPVIAGFKKAANLEASTEPLEMFKKTTIWRCMDGKVYACNFGANLPCASKANTSQTPTQAMKEFCSASPDGDIPMSVTGHDTIYNWRCVKGSPELGAQIAQVDPAGFLANIWYTIEPLP